ncbi:sulfatase [Candidatus Gottesmanbacteria bacterium]|nr:sulfatase [Candidatus Gottesmanbacteria bacterium]
MKTKNTQRILIITIITMIMSIAWISWNSYRKTITDASPTIPSCPDCNVILISLDTLRAKSLPCFGYDKNTAPFLCDLASKSYTFTNAYSQSTYTLDSHMSLFTSLYPTSHGVATPYIHTLSKDVKTLAEVLKQQDYKTYYLGVGIYNDPRLPLKRGLGRGFDTIATADDPQSWKESMEKLDLTSGKFFTFLHTYAVHHPYVPKSESVNKLYSMNFPSYKQWYDACKTRYQRIQTVHPDIFPERDRGKGYNYCNEIAEFYLREGANGKPGELLEKEPLYEEFMQSYFNATTENKQSSGSTPIVKALYESKITDLDSDLKGFFQFLHKKNLLKNTVVIIFGDHGEELFEHGQLTHGTQLYDETIHVPMIISVPNAQPRRIDKLAQLIDIIPTLLPMLTIPVPAQAQGINLLSDTINDYVFSETSIDRKRAIIGRDWKLIVNNDTAGGGKTRELYQRSTDPNERQNLSLTNTLQADALERLLTDQVARRKVYKPTTQDFPADINEEDRQKLLQTGYR